MRSGRCWSRYCRRRATPAGAVGVRRSTRAGGSWMRSSISSRGIAWGALPAGVPPAKTVYGVFRRWTAAGAWARVHDALRDRARLRAGRRPTPTAAVIDSASVRGADTVPARSRGYDAGKKVNGRKRHLAVDTGGLLLA